MKTDAPLVLFGSEVGKALTPLGPDDSWAWWEVYNEKGYSCIWDDTETRNSLWWLFTVVWDFFENESGIWSAAR